MASAGEYFGRPPGENLTAVRSHRKGMLPLSGQAPVSGGNRPAIFGIQFRMSLSCIDHGFNGKRHALG